MSEINHKAAIEAILFANGDSVDATRIAQALELSEKDVHALAQELMEEYAASQRGITIIKLDDAYQMVSSKEYAPQIRTVMDLRRNTPLSQAALEVLAVVAYNQPVTKALRKRADWNCPADRCSTARPRIFCVASTCRAWTTYLPCRRTKRRTHRRKKRRKRTNRKEQGGLFCCGLILSSA